MSYDRAFVNLTKKFGAELGYNDTYIIVNGVYWFSKRLPYSIDPQNEKFVSGSFLHNEFDKDDAKIKPAIKWGETIHKCFVGVENDDKYRGLHIQSGNLLQVCYMLQRMLMGELEVPNEEVDLVSYYKIRETNDPSYNDRVKAMLKKMPEWCLMIKSCENYLQRAEKLDKIYQELHEAIGRRVYSTNRQTFGLYHPDSDVQEFVRSKCVNIDLEPKMNTILSYVQLFVSTIIPELQRVYNNLVLRGNQLHSIKLVLIQILKDKYGISNIDYSLLFEMIGLDFSSGLRKKDCLKLVKKKLK